MFAFVHSDRLDGALLKRGDAGGHFFRGLGLVGDEAVARVFLPVEDARSSLAAEVAVDARVVDVEPARRILGDFPRTIGHCSLGPPRGRLSVKLPSSRSRSSACGAW